MATTANPYPGLRPFDTSEARYFFGRTETATKLARLVTQPAAGSRFALVGVIGASGSGKSSVVRAGLIPHLAADSSAGSEWIWAVARPGSTPLRNISDALAAIAGSNIGPDLLRFADRLGGESTMLRTLAEAINQQRPNTRILLVLDQLEEIFAFSRNPSERQDVLENVMTACAFPQPALSVVATIRADFYGECSAHPGLAEALSSSQVLLGPLTEEEAVEAIHRPSELAGGYVENGLLK